LCEFGNSLITSGLLTLVQFSLPGRRKFLVIKNQLAF
jgi:hypothetical protein